MDSALLGRRIVALLFAATRPCTVRQLVEYLHVGEGEVRASLKELQESMSSTGIVLVQAGESWELATHPDAADDVRLVREVSLGELTRPALETLTVIAYRGPIRQRDIEAIRGVNCTLVLRNLLMRGFIHGEGEGEVARFAVTTEALRAFGLASVTELPEYERFHADAKINQLLEKIFSSSV